MFGHLQFMNTNKFLFYSQELNSQSNHIHKLSVYEYSLKEMCPDVRSKETCAKPIGEAPLAHPILDVRMTEDMSMTSRIKTMIKDTVGKLVISFT